MCIFTTSRLFTINSVTLEVTGRSLKMDTQIYLNFNIKPYQ